MERRRYYHFLLPKSEEEQQQKLYGDGPRPLSFDVVEVRKNSGGDHPPETLPLFPWDLKVELPLNQIGGYGPIELSSEQAFDYVLKHWDAGTVSRMISHGQEQIPIVVQDLESGFKHDIYLVRSTEGGGEEKYKIHLHWKQKNVRKQGDRDTLLIGIYWNIISSCLCLSVLDGPC
ncbi:TRANSCRIPTION FACTOR B3-DOMAIN FAMILY-RELATED [Salix purpurea]|uniref:TRANSCRIPTION FACTOR B3-DOMAIN FAMILY-RELATED n=1 Tax=Salix purpurea TaxID=77065 RepID=A0A9Q1ALQ0_SALPP|nr:TRANSCRIPTION FACTOR B3-DOMAIN FAMILY-RELATED [Salix purpurea]